jgi:hypothetical protein
MKLQHAVMLLLVVIVIVRFDDIKSFVSRNVRDFNTEMQSPDGVQTRQDLKHALTNLRDTIAKP